MRGPVLTSRLPKLTSAAKVALVLAGGLVALAVADLADVDWVDRLGADQIASTVLAEAVLLLGVYLIIEDALAKRQQREWHRAAAGQVANLDYRVTLLAQRFEAAINTLDDREAWRQFQESVWWFRLALERSQAILTSTAELAGIWQNAEQLAHLAEWFASRDPTRLSQELTEPVPQQSRRAFPVMARQLLRDTAAFQQRL